jgi:hypothetical protein
MRYQTAYSVSKTITYIWYLIVEVLFKWCREALLLIQLYEDGQKHV